MKVDVVLLTKNSVSRNAPGVFERSLKSILNNVPVDKLIIVDGFSNDGTLDLIHRFFNNVEVIRTCALRGKAREIGIKHVETPYFMFVDDDVILCKDWFKKATKYLNEDVGAVWGLNFDITPSIKNRYYLRLLEITARGCFNIRGGMHDILILHESVKDIKIPKELHAYEDAYIINWIKKKGYKVVIGEDIYCLHRKPPHSYALREGIRSAMSEVKYGLALLHLYTYSLYYTLLTSSWFFHFLSVFKNAHLNKKSKR